MSELLGVETYVLRYWESEFPVLSPKKSGTGHRLYRRKDVELLLRIKHLLYEKRFTIEGARKFLETRGKGEPARPVKAQKQAPKKVVQAELFAPPPAVDEAVLKNLRKELLAIVEMLK